MNKKFLVGITTVLVSAFMAYGVSRSMNNSNTKLSDLTLANIEALAQNEGGEGCGLADPTKPIWDVEIKIGGAFPSFPYIICRTGGCYVCSKPEQS